MLKYAAIIVTLFQFLNLNFAVGFMMGIGNSCNCISRRGRIQCQLLCLFLLDSWTHFGAGGFLKDNSTEFLRQWTLDSIGRFLLMINHTGRAAECLKRTRSTEALKMDTDVQDSGTQILLSVWLKCSHGHESWVELTAALLDRLQIIWLRHL